MTSKPGSQSDGQRGGVLRRRAEDVPTLGFVPKTRVLHVRVEPAELAVWRVTAASRGRTLSELVRELLAVVAGECVTQAEERGQVSVSPQTEPARARAKTLEERLEAIGELVDGLPALADRLQAPG